jgi:hypothetical protein
VSSNELGLLLQFRCGGYLIVQMEQMMGTEEDEPDTRDAPQDAFENSNRLDR